MDIQRLTTVAMFGSGVMLAHQVAGKAVRDSFFLSVYPPSMLPRVVIAAALTSLLLALLFSRILSRRGPRPVVPVGFLLSAGAHVAEWYFSAAREVVAVITYLHIVGFGAVLLSGFWSVASEAFDPHTAKKNFGRITGAGTLGGILGGLMAERMAVYFAPAHALLLLAFLHATCAMILWALPKSPAISTAKEAPARLSVPALFRQAPYLGYLAGLVLLGASSAAIIDYLFKSSAAETMARGGSLFRFFAIFYTATQVLTFGAQTFATRFALEKLGLGRTVGSLPLAVGAGSTAALLVPAFPVMTAARAMEFILRGSLYRSGYELLFTPIPPAEKRAAKTVLDVGCDRAGDAVGAGIVQAVLFAAPQFARSQLLGAAIALAVAGAWIASRLDAIYTGVVQKRLLDRAVELNFDEIEDSTTRSVMSQSQVLPILRPPEAPSSRTLPAALAADDTMECLRVLRSGSRSSVIKELSALRSKEALIYAQVVRLLAWNEVAPAAAEVLGQALPGVTGMLVDHLIDQEIPFAIRRRIPRILRTAPSERAFRGLLEGLKDTRFEVRYQCGRALDRVRQQAPELVVSREMIFEFVARELSVGRPIWESRRLLDEAEWDETTGFLDEQVRERADRSLEHLFRLLAIVLPREPLRVAFRGFDTDDPLLRGLAIEYMDSVLPAELRERLYEVVNVKPAGSARRSPEEILAELNQSQQGLVVPRPEAATTASAGGAPFESVLPPTASPE